MQLPPEARNLVDPGEIMEPLLLPLSAMGTVLITVPAVAAVPAVLFLWVFAACRRISALIAGLAWLGYLVYEYSMKLRLLCSGECNIRVDLLLFYPLLIAVSLVAAISAIRCRRGSR